VTIHVWEDQPIRADGTAEFGSFPSFAKALPTAIDEHKFVIHYVCQALWQAGLFICGAQ
jgi:hypothetical protein